MSPKKPLSPKKAARRARMGVTDEPIPPWIVLSGGLLVLLAVLFMTLRPIMDPDTWFHLAFGRIVAEEGSIPRADVFSHTSPGNEWISSGWLASVFMYRLYQVTESGAGLIWMSFVIIGLAYTLAYGVVARWFRAPGTMATLLVLGAGISIARFSPRPDLWSQLGISAVLVTLLLAERHAVARQQAPYSLWGLPVIILAWANLHAGFIAGLLTLAIYGTWLLARIFRNGERWRMPMLLPLLLAAIIWMLNPYGPGLAQLARKIQNIPEVGWILEWMPLLRDGSPLPGAAWVLIVLFTGVAILAATVGRRNVAGWQWGVVALFAAFAIMQRRQVGLASVAIPLALAPALFAMEQHWPALRRGALVLAAAALGLISLMHYRGQLLSDRSFLRIGINCSALPCDASDYLTQFRPPGNMFNSYGLGGFLLFHLGPETKVFIDGRLDVYDHQVWLDWLAVDEGRLAMDEFEQKYDIKSWVVSLDKAIGDAGHLASRLAASANHALVYFDDNVGVFIGRNALAEPHQEFRYVSPWNAAGLLRGRLDDQALQVAAAESERAIKYSNASASAWALGALVANIAGDRENLALALRQANLRNDKNPVLIQARQLLR